MISWVSVVRIVRKKPGRQQTIEITEISEITETDFKEK